MNQERREFLSLGILPARLSATETAWYLGIQLHDIAVLLRAKLLWALGRPASNGQKYFALCDLEELRRNREWLDKATRAIARRWKLKNGTAGEGDQGREQN
jgi:hypothetical protein